MKTFSSVYQIIFLSSLFTACIVILAYGSVQTGYAQTVQPTPDVYPHDSNPFNLTMAEWLERYWVWTASIPRDIHPRDDINGERCGTNQNGPVWFLDVPIEAKVFKAINCEIPEGKAIFIPLLVGECDSGIIMSSSDREIEQCAKEGNDGGNIILSIDGNKLLMVNNTRQSQKDYSLYI